MTAVPGSQQRPASTDDRDPSRGLTAAEVAERHASGRGNDVPTGPSRTVEEIIRSNVVTRFNILLSVLLVVILFVAPPQDALFGLVMVANTAIGIVQELRAKQTLDRLALLSAPKARAVREGAVTEVPINDVVLDDVLELTPGDQVVVDGDVLEADGLEINESLLTGEADPVVKQPGASCLSGSFVVAGSGRYRATRVGRQAYAVALAEEARRFTLVKSELRDGIDWILAAISWTLVPLLPLLVWSQVAATDSVKEALRASVAGAVGVVPQGLVLLTSVAFAVSVVRLGRSNVLVQELPAVEGLARVDVVCFDKTGTLTAGRLDVHGVESLNGIDPAPVLGALAAAERNPNATLRAVGAAFTEPGWVPEHTVPFSSDRKWSGATFHGEGTWVLGAPEVLLDQHAAELQRATHLAAGGERVLLLARSFAPIEAPAPPRSLEPAALVVLGDVIRADAADTLGYFAAQGVAAKVISGDHPGTVAAIARQVGVPGAEHAIDARDLPEDESELRRAVEDYTVFGRVSPHQKRAMVHALQANGHTVAMTGDGVNDVLALKDADIGVAMGGGSSASRAVAQLVLIDGDFATMPSVVAEGRRVINNIERVANLFVTKTVYALVLALVIAVAGRPFPVVPRHLTLVGTITIGLPAFFLALAPTSKIAEPGFIRRVLQFAVPTGLLAGISTFVAYEVAINEVGEGRLVEARTMATMVLAAVGIFVLIIISRPLVMWRKALVGTMAALLLLILALPFTRTFFELDMPRVVVVLAGIGVFSMAGAAMYAGLRMSGWLLRVPEVVPELLSNPPSPVRGWAWLRSLLTEAPDPELVMSEALADAEGEETLPAG